MATEVAYENNNRCDQQASREAPLVVETSWNKMRIIAYLAAVYGYRHYLELCTDTTGNCYGQLDRQGFVTCRRLMYHCEPDFTDGLKIDFRSTDFNIEECLKQIANDGDRPDIVLVDPWHEYETSLRDIEKAFDLVADGGTLVVHDCLPPNLAVASPHYVPGDWCGVTYKAYLDFVTARDYLNFVTVDIDYGCGIIRKATDGEYKTWRRRRLKSFDRNEHFKGCASELVHRWLAFGDDFASAFSFFEQNCRELLHLISLHEFIRTRQAQHERASTFAP